MPDTLSALQNDSTFRPVVLIVEDQASQRNTKAAEMAERGCVPVIVEDSDAAARELTASPGIDLVLTDIRLAPSDGDDKSGVKLARFVHSAHPHLPIVGYSAYFSANDLSDDEIDLFDYAYNKGAESIKEIQVNLDKCAELAFHSRRERKRRAEARLADATGQTSERILEIVRSATLAEVEGVEQVLHEAGFRLKLVRIPSAGNTEPLIVWIRGESGSVDVEVYGHSTLYATGDSEGDALERLVDLIQVYWEELDSQKELSGPAHKLHDFLADLRLRNGEESS
jgi:DNA-binding NtrC family response regulator